MLIAAEGHLKPEQITGFDDIIWVPNSETYASNTIAMENGIVLVSAGFPITKQRLERLDLKLRKWKWAKSCKQMEADLFVSIHRMSAILWNLYGN